jgi:hypothetical protein
MPPSFAPLAVELAQGLSRAATVSIITIQLLVACIVTAHQEPRLPPAVTISKTAGGAQTQRWRPSGKQIAAVRGVKQGIISAAAAWERDNGGTGITANAIDEAFRSSHVNAQWSRLLDPDGPTFPTFHHDDAIRFNSFVSDFCDGKAVLSVLLRLAETVATRPEYRAACRHAA